MARKDIIPGRGGQTRPLPFRAFYSAAKHAVEAYMESLKYEVESQGIVLTLIEPGFFRTNLHHAFTVASGRLTVYDRALGAVGDSAVKSTNERMH